MKLFVLPVLLLAACTSAKTYKLNRVSDTTAQLHITEVGTRPPPSLRTYVKFRYQASEESRHLGVHAPGTKGAFVITDAAETETYELVGVEGIAVLPERTTVGRGEMLEFTLEFRPIPSSLKKINVGEGAYRPDSGETSWHFIDVELK